MTPKRAALDDDTVNAIIFVHDNMSKSNLHEVALINRAAALFPEVEVEANASQDAHQDACPAPATPDPPPA